MRKILVVLKVLKGGPGSGNFGHSGREGQQGGSAETGGKVSVSRFSSKGADKLLPKVKEWGGERAKYAEAALYNIGEAGDIGHVFKGDDGAVLGISSSKYTSGFNNADSEQIARDNGIDTNYQAGGNWDEQKRLKIIDWQRDNLDAGIEIGMMATAPGTKGIGRKLVGKIISDAAKDGRIVSLDADQGAIGFWEKMGFKKFGKLESFNNEQFGLIKIQRMYMLKPDVKAAAAKLKKSDDSEPASGIYCWLHIENNAKRIERVLTAIKGGPGSGNFNHSGRPGEQGGSGEGGGSKAPPDKDTLNTSAEALHKKLNHEERGAIKFYTAFGFQEVNNCLRGKDTDFNCTERSKKTAKLINKALEKAPDQDPPWVTYRGIHADNAKMVESLAALKPGDELTLNGFQSTSINPQVARNFGTTVFEIRSRKGIPIGELSDTEGELEVLLGHGWKYRVADNKPIGSAGARRKIVLEAIHD